MDLNEIAKGYGGIYSLMLTPYKDDLSVDFNAYEAYCEWQAAQGAHKLFAVCGSSEMTKLTPDEREKLARLTVKRGGGLPVWCTANLSESFADQVEEIARMEQTGVSGLVFVTKDYGDDDEKMVDYITKLASHATLPVILYEFPGYTPHYISGAAYGALADAGIIHGLKDTTCTLEGIGSKLERQGDSAVLQANIPFLYDAFVNGARGCVATPSTCGTRLIRNFFDAFASGDLEAAKIAHAHVCSLSDVIDCGFTASAKYMASLQGVDIKPLCRTDAKLAPQHRRNLEVWHDQAVRDGLMK